MAFNKTNRSAFQNYIKAKYERFTGQVENQSLPYFIAIDPSSICQLRCPFCPTGVENAAKKDNRELKFRNRALMVPELFDSLIEELGDNLFYLLFYNWGEPLFNKHLPEFIKKAKTYNIYGEIHTNLSLHVSDENFEKLLLSGIDEIAASIDGFSDESYKTYRQGGNFNLVKSNIERMAKIRDRLGLNTKIIWNFLVFSFNEAEINDCRKYCDDIGIIFNQREAFINIQDHPDWLPSYRKHELESLKKPDAESSTSPTVNLNPVAKEPSCSWHYAMSVINSDGSVSPCCVPWEQEYDFGFVVPNQVKFSDVWNNEYFRKSRAAFSSKPLDGFPNIHTLCEKCPYPASIMNQYVPYEREIIKNFWKTNQGNDYGLEQAFRLLDKQKEFIDYCTRNYDHLFKTNDVWGKDPTRNQDLLNWIGRMKKRLPVLLGNKSTDK